MKKLFLILSICTVAGCGTMGVGSNHKTNIYNNSAHSIRVKSDTGVYSIKPESSMTVSSVEDMTVTSRNRACPKTVIAREPNTAAIILDVFPGLLLGIIPVLVDAISNNLYKMPESYSYSCTDKRWVYMDQDL